MIFYFSVGVNKLGLLANTELEDGVTENHDSLSQLVNECGIPEIPHETMSWGGDQKVLNDACGVGNHKSTYPCGHCLAKFPFNGDEKAELRTLGHLDDCYANFERDGKKKKNAKKYYSVINKRFIHGPRDKKVLKCFPCPVLHYKLRATNYILEGCAKRCMKKVKRNLVKEFAIQHNIVKKAYHGGEFEVSVYFLIHQSKVFIVNIDQSEVCILTIDQSEACILTIHRPST